MMYLGLFTLVVLPLFLIVPAKVIKGGEDDHAGRIITGIALIVNVF